MGVGREDLFKLENRKTTKKRIGVQAGWCPGSQQERKDTEKKNHIRVTQTQKRENEA